MRKNLEKENCWDSDEETFLEGDLVTVQASFAYGKMCFIEQGLTGVVNKISFYGDAEISFYRPDDSTFDQWVLKKDFANLLCLGAIPKATCRP